MDTHSSDRGPVGGIEEESSCCQVEHKHTVKQTQAPPTDHAHHNGAVGATDGSGGLSWKRGANTNSKS